MPEVSVIIPTYNEAGNVRPLAEAISGRFAGVDCELVVVDDSSPDGTADAVKSLPQFGKTVFLIERKGKLGLAGAVLDGARAARGEWVIVMDADLSHPPETARQLFERRNDADIVVASRRAGGGTGGWAVHRDLISRGAESICRLLLPGRTADPMSGLFLVRREMLLGTRLKVRGYKILLNLLYGNPSASVADVPYVFRKRHSGETKLGVAEILNYPADLLRLLL